MEATRMATDVNDVSRDADDFVNAHGARWARPGGLGPEYEWPAHGARAARRTGRDEQGRLRLPCRSQPLTSFVDSAMGLGAVIPGFEHRSNRPGLPGATAVTRRPRSSTLRWANYFCLGQVSPAYAAVDQHTTRRLRRWLCRKHKVRSGKYVRLPDAKLWEDHKLARLGPRTASFPWAKA